MTSEAEVSSAPADLGWEQLHADYSRELLGYCYRMLGSAHDADDAVQETMIRAWRGIDRFAGRSTPRVWLYRIATNVCLDMLRGRNRREQPISLLPAGTADSPLGDPEPGLWVQPAPTRWLLPEGPGRTEDPSEITVRRDSVRLAFVAALQRLLPRQRAMLILCDVLRWPAGDAATLLDITNASANGMLRRARQRLAGVGMADTDVRALTPQQQDLLVRYVDAFERNDIERLTSLLHEDATLSMPPYPLWLSGRAQLERWFRRSPNPCSGARTVPVEANGMPGFAVYHRTESGQAYEAFGVQLLTIRDMRIGAIDIYLQPDLFPELGLPARLDPVAVGELAAATEPALLIVGSSGRLRPVPPALPVQR